MEPKNSFRQKVGAKLNRPVLRIAVPAVLVLVVVVAALWAGGVFSGSQTLPGWIPPDTQTERPPGPADRPLQVTVFPDPEGYLPGQTVKAGLQFSNIGPEPIALNNFPPEVHLVSREWKTVGWSESGSGDLTLKPGETKTYIMTWDQKDDTGGQVTPGKYLVVVKNVTYVHGDPVRTTTASFGSTWFTIRDPRGALEQTVELNQSQTVNDITITLEKLELSSEGTMFGCFFVPSYEVSLSGPSAHAEYSYDGVIKDAGLCGYGTRDNGYKLIWGSSDLPLNPVPAGTKELTFTIIRLDDREGPWVFNISLD